MSPKDDANVKLPKQVEAMEQGAAPESNAAEEPAGKAPALDAAAPASEPPREPPSPPPQAATQPEHDWQAAYKTLKGKYDAEVPALQRRIKELETVVDAQQNKPADIKNLRDVLTEEQREELDPDQIDATERMVAMAREQASAELRQVHLETFKMRLDALAPSWRQSNNNPEFLAWLDQPAPMTGRTRWELFSEARDRFDGETCAEFFNAWMAESAGNDPEERLQQVSVPAPVQAGSGAAPSEKKVWKESEVAEFYSDLSKGRYGSNPELAQQIDQDINAAAAEGRITKG